MEAVWPTDLSREEDDLLIFHLDELKKKQGHLNLVKTLRRLLEVDDSDGSGFKMLKKMDRAAWVIRIVFDAVGPETGLRLAFRSSDLYLIGFRSVGGADNRWVEFKDDKRHIMGSVDLTWAGNYGSLRKRSPLTYISLSHFENAVTYLASLKTENNKGFFPKKQQISGSLLLIIFGISESIRLEKIRKNISYPLDNGEKRKMDGWLFEVAKNWGNMSKIVRKGKGKGRDTLLEYPIGDQKVAKEFPMALKFDNLGHVRDAISHLTYFEPETSSK